jgi:ribosomal protein L23
MLKPVLTEKSLALAKKGGYTFLVDLAMTKNQIREVIEKTFGVNVTRLRTLKIGQELKKNAQGRKCFIASQKKAICCLADKQKIDLFEQKESK